jgi:GNAT superfamily N-acetyltransferase
LSRNPVQVRDAEPHDALALLELWSGLTSRLAERDATPRELEAAASVARIAADPDQQLLVAVLEGAVVGATHLILAPLTPVHGEMAVHVAHLHVHARARRHGVGRALMEAAVSWAEEKDTAHLLAAASVGSRDANRFMARLGLGQVAVIRGASVAALRAKLPVEPPAAARVGSRSHRNVGHVLAQRRSQRRAQARLS